jgi:hypothetical protein
VYDKKVCTIFLLLLIFGLELVKFFKLDKSL